MKSEIELARARQERTSELATGLRYARERLALYRAKSYGPKLTSPARLRELERAAELAETRLHLAQAAPDTGPPAAGTGVDAAEQDIRGETDEGVGFR
jgi:hypothetical protein